MTKHQRAALDTDLATLKAFLTPERWTHGAIARREDGRRVEPDADDAVRFCVIGACLHHGMKRLVVTFLERRAGQRAGQAVNDFDGYNAVVALLHPVTDLEAAA